MNDPVALLAGALGVSPPSAAALAAGLAGFALGTTLAALSGRARRARLEGVAEERTRQLADVEERVAAERAAAEAGRERVMVLERERAGLAQQLAAEQRGAAEKLALLHEAEQKLREAFTALSADALHKNTQSFLELAKAALGEFQQNATKDLESRQQAIDALVKPVAETLGKVDAQLREVEKERHGHYQTLTEQMQQVARSHEQLHTATASLSRALRAPAVRGRWGEVQLRRVVELAGMLAHCDFTEQPTVTTDDGRLRPDLVVHLPGGKHVVVDSKTPLEAYLDAVEAPDDAAREAALHRHAQGVRDHMAKLGGKAYWQQFQPTPEFVVMFLPGETFFAAALEQDPGLTEWGAERKVILASPTTLIALLRAVAYGWQQERIARNAEEISRLGRELYERMGKLAEHLATVGQRLGGTVRAYNDAVGSIESRVLPAARRFQELGAGSGGAIVELTPVEEPIRSIGAPEPEER
jgi:DNA recombination protein RmuC